MGKIIAVTNQKGGVGKTTTAINLSAALARDGEKVLLVDIDPQGNTTSGTGIDKNSINNCIYDILINEFPIDKVVVSAKKNLDVVPATIQLAGAEVELVSTVSREVKLKNALTKIKNRYSYILIDCPPSLGLLTINALTAADEVLIPIQCEYYALEGLGQLMNTIDLVKRHLNKELRVGGVVLTMYDSRTNLSSQVAGEVKDYFKELVHGSIIPRNVRLSEAPSHGKPIIDYDDKCKGSEVYLKLAQEVKNK